MRNKRKIKSSWCKIGCNQNICLSLFKIIEIFSSNFGRNISMHHWTFNSLFIQNMTNWSSALYRVCKNDTACVVVFLWIQSEFFDKVEKRFVFVMFSKFYKLMIKISQIHVSFIINHLNKIWTFITKHLLNNCIHIACNSGTSHQNLSFA